MKYLICILLAYLIGTLNPAALISKLKRKSLRDHGTGNLGATNTMLIFGKKLGALVMILDILKGFWVVKLTAWLLPGIEWIPMAAGFAAVIGHCFPFYLKFKGGKGLAAFAGVVLAYHPLLFLFLLGSGVSLMILVNYGVILPYYAAVAFSVFVWISGESLPTCLCAFASSALVMVMHFGNILKAIRGQDRLVRPLIKTMLFHWQSKK